MMLRGAGPLTTGIVEHNSVVKVQHCIQGQRTAEIDFQKKNTSSFSSAFYGSTLRHESLKVM
jgi:hypothetical protein